MVTKKVKKTVKPAKKTVRNASSSDAGKEIKEIAKEVVSEKNSFPGKYFYGLGKRKTAVAQVRIYPASSSNIEIIVNGKEIEKYLTIARHQDLAKSPFAVAGKEGGFSVSAKIFGGGISSQAEALRLGISRALIKFDESLRRVLKSSGFLTRDSRIVERKKPGKKKARRSPQWAKR